jgi:hypothetical protein
MIRNAKRLPVEIDWCFRKNWQGLYRTILMSQAKGFHVELSRAIRARVYPFFAERRIRDFHLAGEYLPLMISLC